MSGKDKFYISTALPYVNAPPHIGFALEILQADVIARHQRLLGKDVFFLTGTDENSLKNVRAADKKGVPVKELVNENAEKFYQLKTALNLTFDDFIRTTEERHIKGVQKLWQACQKDIYKKNYRGLYCVDCEEFYKEEKLESGFCPEHKVKPELVEEENYFFKLSKYEEQLREIIKKDKVRVIPETRKNETLSFINQGLEDICISRSAKRAHQWGILVPGDPEQIIWVWFDALSNYITALDYGENGKKLEEWWQKNVNKLHVIGKGILRFHAIYWLGMLLSAKLSLPKEIFVHGYITSGGQKMSKSLGNVIDPFELVEKYGTDAVRYFLLREISPFEDGDFTYERFRERYNADLAGGLGNLVARVLTMTEKRNIEKATFSQVTLRSFIDTPRIDYQKAIRDFKFNEALSAVWKIIGSLDKYIERERPWENSKNSNQVISNLLSALTEIAKLLEPFLPETSAKIFEQLKTKKGKSLFPRLNP